MDNKGIKFLIITLAMFSILTLALSLNQETSQVINPSNNIDFKGATFCYETTGDFEGRITTPHTGINELIECSHNLLTNAGANASRNMLGSGAGSAFDYIALCNATAGCAAAAATDTTLENEYIDSGLERTLGTYAIVAGTGNWTISNTFTSSGTGTYLVNKTGTFNASSGGAMLSENTFTLATLDGASGDTLTITASYNLA